MRLDQNSMNTHEPTLISWFRRIAVPIGRVLRIPFLWLLMGFLVFVLQSIWESFIPAAVPGAGYSGAELVSALGRFLIGVGVGYFIGFHYRHWTVLVAAGLLYFPVVPFASPEAAIGILIGYGWICSRPEGGMSRRIRR